MSDLVAGGSEGLVTKSRLIGPVRTESQDVGCGGGCCGTARAELLSFCRGSFCRSRGSIGVGSCDDVESRKLMEVSSASVSVVVPSVNNSLVGWMLSFV